MANTPQAEFYALGQSIVKTRPLEFYYVATFREEVATFREEEVPNTHWDKLAFGDRQSKTATMKSDGRLALVYFVGKTRKTKPMLDLSLTPSGPNYEHRCADDSRLISIPLLANLCLLHPIKKGVMAGSCSVNLLRIIATSLRIS